MSLSLPNPLQTRRPKTILSPEGTTAKFLYTILKQLDLKTVDWNEVAAQLDISNGHAARMRYSRFKLQIEGLSNDNKSKSKPERKDKVAKQKTKRKRGREAESDHHDSLLEPFHEDEFQSKKMEPSTADNWHQALPGSVLKAEQDQNNPNTTILSIKTEHGLQQARIHSPTTTFFNRDDQVNKQAMAKPFARQRHDNPYVHPQYVNQPPHGTVAMPDLYVPQTYPAQRAQSAMQNHMAHQHYTNDPGQYYHSRAMRPRSIYSNVDANNIAWYNDMSTYAPQTAAYPVTNYSSLHEAPNAPMHPWHYPPTNSSDLMRFSSSRQAVGDVNNEQIPRSNFDMGHFATEFGDWSANGEDEMLAGSTHVADQNNVSSPHFTPDVTESEAHSNAVTMMDNTQSKLAKQQGQSTNQDAIEINDTPTEQAVVVNNTDGAANMYHVPPNTTSNPMPFTSDSEVL